LTLVNGVQWFLVGVCLAVTAAIAGREAGERERGRVFGTLGTTISLGSLLGGLTMGRMTDAWGYPGMLSVSAGFILLIPVAAVLLVRKEPFEASRGGIPEPRSFGPLFTAAFLLLLLAQIFTTVSTAEGNLGRSLAMSAASFRSAEITTTAAIGGLVALPIPFLLGWLSDRVGRKPVMIASPLFGAASLLLLLVSRSLWQFYGVAVLSALMVISVTVGPALVADVVRQERVGTGLAFYQSSVWIGFIIGYASSGAAFQRLGMQAGLELGMLCTFMAVPLLLAVRKPRVAASAAG